MPPYVCVASIGEVPIGEARSYIVGDLEIALFNVGGVYYALENTCPHQGGPLAEGHLEGTVVTCPWHAWCFDVTSGATTLGGPNSVNAFDVQIVGSEIRISSEPRT